MEKVTGEILIELPFLSDEFRSKWDEWIEYRRLEKRQPKYTDTGLKRTFTRLKRISNNNEETAIAILDEAMELQYIGFFPLKNTRTNEQQTRTDTRKSDLVHNLAKKYQQP